MDKTITVSFDTLVRMTSNATIVCPRCGEECVNRNRGGQRRLARFGEWHADCSEADWRERSEQRTAEERRRDDEAKRWAKLG